MEDCYSSKLVKGIMQRALYPLHVVVTSSDLDRVRSYIARGIDVNGKDSAKKTPLHYAMGCIEDPEERYRISKYLIDHGADLDEPDGLRQQTPLHFLLRNRHTAANGRLLDFLLEREVDVNRKDCLGYTPLHLAVIADDTGCVRKLLQRGADTNGVADPTSKLNNRMTALSKSIENKNIDLVRILLRHRANVNDSEVMYAAAASNSKDILQILFDYNIDFREYDYPNNEFHKNYFELVHYIISWQRSETFECMTENMDVRIDEFSLHSALHPVWNLDLGDRILNLMIKEIAIMGKNEEKFVPAATCRIIEENSELKEKLQWYEQQIDLMRESNLPAGLNYFDLLSKNRDHVLKLCNDDLLFIIYDSQPESLFPDFIDRVRRNIERGLSDKKVKEDFEFVMHDILKHKLPVALSDYVCQFLKLTDMVEFRYQEEVDDS